MINGKGIRLLCKILMTIVCILSIISLIAGICLLISEENWFYLIFIIVGIVFPLVTTVSLYPIYALANIDENLILLNKKIDRVFGEGISKPSQPTEPIVLKNDIPTESQPTQSRNEAKKVDREYQVNDKRVQEAINFVNSRYGTDIRLEDEFEVIVRKVCHIGERTSSVIIFQKNVCSARTKQEVLNAIIKHNAVNA